MEYIHQPHSPRRLGDYLNHEFSQSWTQFRAAVAFVKRTGTRHIRDRLRMFAQHGHVEIIAGIDHRGTSNEGLRDLLDAVHSRGRIILFHNPLPYTFHPKLYLFKSTDRAEVLLGSANLTEGGLYTNYESTIRLVFDLSNPEDVDTLRSFERGLDQWSDVSTGNAHVLESRLLDRLTANGLVPLEAQSPTYVQVPSSPEGESLQDISPFKARAAPPPPRVVPAKQPPLTIGPRARPPLTHPPRPESDACTYTNFVITLQRTDVGIGQTTSGTSRRSPELFIPLTAREACPAFWDWPGSFLPDLQNPGKRDRTDVQMLFGTEIITVNMMTWPAKRDFRIRSEHLRSAGEVDDILHLHKTNPNIGYDYIVEIIPTIDERHTSYLSLCDQTVRNSLKTYGYY